MAWSNLPFDIVMKISEHHDTFIDKLRLRCVCSAWLAALRPHTNHHHLFVHVIPDAIKCDTNSHVFSTKRTIFLISPADSVLNNANDLYPFILKIEKIHPSINNKFRSLHPLFLSRDNYYSKYFPKVMNLLDIRITELEDEHVLCYESVDYNLYNKKVVYLSLLNGNDYAVLVMTSLTDKLAMFCSVDRQSQAIRYTGWRFSDVIGFNGEFYAVDNYGRTVVISFDSGDMVLVAAKLEGVEDGSKTYLVQLGNELLLVVRHEIDKSKTPISYKIDVYKLDRNGSKWVKINSLGDRVLFLGDACAFSTSASDLKWFNIMGNHICYIDDHRDIGRHSLRAYDMETKTDWDPDDHCYSKLFWPPPSWITYSTS